MTARRIAILSRGDRSVRDSPDGGLDRFTDLVDALRAAGHSVGAAVFDEQFADEVRAQLLDTDLVLVWVNPIDAGRTRAVLDALLREVAATGVTVSSHPEVILQIGTKQVLHETRDLGWGCDTNLYRTVQELTDGLTASLALGPRVIKQHRGSSGHGVWSVQLANDAGQLQVRHAARGSEDELMSMAEFVGRCAPYFVDGLTIDQAFQPRIGEGMTRCYLVKDQVAGFGIQATNALIPVEPGQALPELTKRTYHPPTRTDCQQLKEQLEQQWVPKLCEHFGLAVHDLPLLWDCDFLLGPTTASGDDSFVLCEINVSSVSPYPESVVPFIVTAIGHQ